jgi:hypothetical protein
MSNNSTFNLTFKEIDIDKPEVNNPPYIELEIKGENVEVELGRMFKETVEMVKKRIIELIKDYFEGRGDLGSLVNSLYSIMEDVVVEDAWTEWFINAEVSTDIDDYNHNVKIRFYLK